MALTNARNVLDNTADVHEKLLPASEFNMHESECVLLHMCKCESECVLLYTRGSRTSVSLHTLGSNYACVHVYV